MASKARIWAGRGASGLVALFLLVDGTMKLIGPSPVVEGSARLGYAAHLLVPLGIIELSCAILYLIPQTSALGALLLTGFLGGAVATHFRVEDPLLGFTFFPLYVATLAWAGLLLRDRRLRVLVPFTH